MSVWHYCNLYHTDWWWAWLLTQAPNIIRETTFTCALKAITGGFTALQSHLITIKYFRIRMTPILSLDMYTSSLLIVFDDAISNTNTIIWASKTKQQKCVLVSLKLQRNNIYTAFIDSIYISEKIHLSKSLAFMISTFHTLAFLLSSFHVHVNAKSKTPTQYTKIPLEHRFQKRIIF